MKRCVRSAFALVVLVACVAPGARAAQPEAERRAAEFAAAIEREPGDAAAVEGRVLALLALDRWEDALTESALHHARLDGDARVAAVHAEALFRAGELELAEALLVELERAAAAAPRALTVLGLLHSARGRSADAVDLMNRAVAAAPDDPDVLFRAAEATESRAEATRRLERYLALAADDDADRVAAARGTLDVLRELGEREVWAVAERPQTIELRLTRLAGGGGATAGVVVRAEVGEKSRSLRLLLDSGSGGLFLPRRVALRNGFTTLAAETIFGGGGTRRQRTERGLLARLALGGLVYEDALTTASDGEIDPAGRYQGVIGLAPFDGYTLTLDLRRGRLRATLGGGSIAGAPYWMIAGQMLVRAEAVGGPQGIFLLDTGASVSVVDAAWAERLAGTSVERPATVRGFGGLVEGARELRGLRLTFEGVESGVSSLRAADFSLRSRLGGVQLAGFLGMDLLGGQTLIVDTVSRRVRFEAEAAKP